MKWFFVLFSLLSSVSYAGGDGEITSVAQLIGLPAYCRGTQQIRNVSQDPTPMSVYVKRYGYVYTHLHHYCWALNTENSIAMNNPKDGRFWLGTAISNIDYVLKNNQDPKFILLPEIYVSKARIFFKMDQPDDAVPWLKKAIAQRSNYSPAYARLSDYYVEKGDKAEAIKILKQGLAKSSKSDMLIHRLRELESPDGNAATTGAKK